MYSNLFSYQFDCYLYFNWLRGTNLNRDLKFMMKVH